MKTFTPICLSLLTAALSIVSAHADDSDEKAALLALADRAFAAVHSQDPDDWRALQMADGVTLSFRQDPDGAPGEQLLRMSRNEDFISGLEHDGHDLAERWIGEPTVLIRGPIAVIWGEYEFYVDGAFSHCGVDGIDAIKVDGEWKIANFMWTVETEGCAAG